MLAKIVETIPRRRTFKSFSHLKLTSCWAIRYGLLFGEENEKMTGRPGRTSLAIILAALTALAPVAPAFAQKPEQSSAPPEPQPVGRTIPVSTQNYTYGKRWFPNIIAPYTQALVPEPVLTNAPRIEQMVQDGKLTISLQDAVDLALQNNLSIVIERYVPWVAEANILRTLSGAQPLGGTVNALGNIPALSFDPQLTSNFIVDQRSLPVNNGLTGGTGIGTGILSQQNTHTLTGDVGYNQGFHTGTFVSATFNNTRTSFSNSGNFFFNPVVQSNLIIAASQQLLNGFGRAANEHYIRIAKVNKSIADQTLVQQVITSITAVGNAYWELVFARGSVDVAKQEIALADKTYSDNKKQVDVGTLAPLEIVQAEAQLATAQQALIVAQTTVLQDQLTLLNLISKDPNSPILRTVEIVPSDKADVAPPEVEKLPLEDLIKEATTKRPDVLQAGLVINGDAINIQATRNALRPILTLNAEYATEGLAGDTRLLTTCTPVPPAVTCVIPPQIFSGLPTALNQAFTNAYPEYNASINLTIPIRNRLAQANNVIATLNKRSDESNYQLIVNNAVTDVHNAQITLEQARITLAAAVKTRDLDQQTLDAEQKKFQVGASTLFNIVSDQNTLAAAESAEVRARVNLVEGKVNFDRAMGRTLEVYSISIAGAKSGNPTKDTLIPGTSANGQLFLTPAKSNNAAASAANQPTRNFSAQ
jgi:outer membrane protein